MKGLKHKWITSFVFMACFILVFHMSFADDTCLFTTDGGPYTFTAPVVPVSKTTSSNRVYLTFFYPGEGNFWAGNVVKFGINEENQIVDALYDPDKPEHSNPESPYNRLVLDLNGVIKEGAVPYWATIDWADPTKSDYNYILNSDRNIYTYLDSSTDMTAAANAFIPTNPNLTPAVLGNPTHTLEEIIGYIRGADVFDEDNNKNTQENRAVITGDVQHSEPLVVQYNYPDNSSKTSKTMVYFGSNDGMLHAVLDTEIATDGKEVEKGTEAWAFIPPDQLHKLKDIIEGDVHQYFVDSSPKTYFKDVNSNGVIDSGDGDKIILVCGERKGGTSYFALDITDPFAPVFLWRINQYDDAKVGTLELVDVTGTFGDGEVLTGSSGGSATVEGAPVGNFLRYELRTHNFTVGEVVTGVPSGATGTIVSITNYAPDVIISELGQTWSEPRFGLVKTWDDEDEEHDDGTPVFFIGGGYSSDNSAGKAVIAVNVFTGAVENKFSNITGMNYSIPSSVTLVDGDSNGFVDKVYVGDLGGQMWRFGKFTDSKGVDLEFPYTDENIMNWTNQAAHILFLSDPAHGRKFFYPPSVTLEWGYDLVFMGTGDREDPCNTSSSDRIYAVKDMHVFITLDESDLVNVTNTEAPVPDLNKEGDVDGNDLIDQGWYIRLAEGEKVLSEGVVFLKTYYVTTFLPGQGGKLYALNYKTGEAVYRSLRVIGEADGFLSKPVVVINKTDQKLLVSASRINPGEGGSESVGPGILAIEPSAPSANFFYLWWREL